MSRTVNKYDLKGNLLMDYPREFYAVYPESSKRRGVAL